MATPRVPTQARTSQPSTGQDSRSYPGATAPPIPATAARGWTAATGTREGSWPTGDKVIDTVLGPVSLTRAWYHCAACKHGFAPRDAELGVAGASLSPGLAAMTDRAAAAGPFAEAARL